MDENKKILAVMGLLLDKKDTRTINKLGENHPGLYRLVKHIGSERISDFLKEGNMGAIDSFLPLTEEDLLEIYQMRERVFNRDLEIEKRRQDLERHLKENLFLKMEKFYRSKAGGGGLKAILSKALSDNLEIVSHADIDTAKPMLISLVAGYQTSLAKLEAPAHKKIVTDFIEENITAYEALVLIETKGVVFE